MRLQIGSSKRVASSKSQCLACIFTNNLVVSLSISTPDFLIQQSHHQMIHIPCVHDIPALTQASTFAPLSSLGSKDSKINNLGLMLFECNEYSPANMLTTLRRIFSTLCTGLQRSELLSYMLGSSPGGWRIEIHTVPLA